MQPRTGHMDPCRVRKSQTRKHTSRHQRWGTRWMGTRAQPRGHIDLASCSERVIRSWPDMLPEHCHRLDRSDRPDSRRTTSGQC
eukprot:422012-Rhodomonas_salina.3